MQLSDDQMQQLVADATQNLQIQLQQSLVKRLEITVTESAARLIHSHVEAWIKQNVLPDVTTLLEDGKAALLASSIEGANAIAEGLAEGMKDTALKNLENPYRRSEIFKTLFQ